MEGLKGRNWTVQKTQSGRSKTRIKTCRSDCQIFTQNYFRHNFMAYFKFSSEVTIFNFSDSFPSSFKLFNFSQNFPTAAKLSDFSESFQLRSALSNFARLK